MKIYINRQPRFGPWGGGAKTVNKLAELLLSKGHTVLYNLQENIDVIFCFDPRPNAFGESINHLYAYREKSPKTKIVQRVGDLGTHSKPHLTDLVRYCLNKSDYFIFPSQWSKEWIGFQGKNCDIIDNAPMKIFYNNRNTNLQLGDKIRVVTHHWSTNPKKGFDVYQKFEEWCKDKDISFHYIGQLPSGVNFNNYIQPISAAELSQELPKYDIYLTASEEEAGANHVLEAMASGLPVVYRKSGGSIDNYCNYYGEKYSEFDDMIEKINKVTKNYSKSKQRVLEYTKTNDFVIDEYHRIIKQVYENKHKH